MVKVSICVPAYKNPVGVERLLESIKVQSFTDYEVVVTDDSPDGSVEEVVRRAEVPGIVDVYKRQEQDLYLMSCCKNHILANSSFSWWGAWLDNGKDKLVIAPEKLSLIHI